MKAAVCHGFSSITLREVVKPAPADNQALIRVQATTVCAADYRMRKAWPLRFILGAFKPGKPTIFGMELAGTVESTGKAVTKFRAGDAVFGLTGLKLGAHAEYACVPESMIELKPANMTVEESAAVAFGGMTALPMLRLAKIAAGQKVLVYGASGSVGVFAVQLAKHFGARVTAVCSTANVSLVRSLGADEVIDYTREDYSKAAGVYDVVFDAVGKSGYRRSARSLKKGGTHVVVAMSGGMLSIFPDIVRQMWIRVASGVKVVGGLTRPAPGDLAFLKGLIEAGQLRTVIDRRYRLDQMGEAQDYAGAGHKKGHVVIRIAEEANFSLASDYRNS